MTTEARRRSDEFLRIADQFKLGDLVTESSHPVTANLSQVAQRDTAEALKLLFTVDEDVLAKFREVADSGMLNSVARRVVEAVRGGGRVFFTGCGSTGRLSILLESIWREFWQGYADRQVAERWEDRVLSVMAGGDFALIKAVEGFEDYTEFGRKQIRELGVRQGDVVFAVTEGGETSFVIGTAWEGLEAGAQVFFVYNNPDEILCRTVQRSREVIEEPRIEKINLTTGPMAISGSTRMQATTIELCVLVTVLEMVVRELLGGESGHSGVDAHQDSESTFRGVPSPGGEGQGEGEPQVCERESSGESTSSVRELLRLFLRGIEEVLAGLKQQETLAALARLVEAEEQAYRSNRKANYYADRFAIDVLTDTTERSPTFSTPPFRKANDTSASESWAFLVVPGRETESAWNWLLKREPRCLAWGREDVEEYLAPEKLEPTCAILRGITREELMQFRIGRDGVDHRALKQGDYALYVVGSGERSLAVGVPESGVRRGLLRFIAADEHSQASAPPSASKVDGLGAGIVVPRTGLLLDGLTRVCVKMVLNAISTCVMVRLGRVMGNTMIYVVASNLKLIDRATRYIVRLTGLSYQEANLRLFEALEYLEPRMRQGQTCPPVVGLVVARCEQGADFRSAEQRLSEPG